MEPTLVQSLYRRNDSEVFDLLDRKDGWLAERARELSQASHDSPRSPADFEQLDSFIESAFLRTLSRFPNKEESVACRRHFTGSPSKAGGLRDILWALLNTQEFVTNH